MYGASSFCIICSIGLSFPVESTSLLGSNTLISSIVVLVLGGRVNPCQVLVSTIVVLVLGKANYVALNMNVLHW